MTHTVIPTYVTKKSHDRVSVSTERQPLRFGERELSLASEVEEAHTQFFLLFIQNQIKCPSAFYFQGPCCAMPLKIEFQCTSASQGRGRGFDSGLWPFCAEFAYSSQWVFRGYPLSSHISKTRVAG